MHEVTHVVKQVGSFQLHVLSALTSRSFAGPCFALATVSVIIAGHHICHILNCQTVGCSGLFSTC